MKGPSRLRLARLLPCWERAGQGRRRSRLIRSLGEEPVNEIRDFGQSFNPLGFGAGDDDSEHLPMDGWNPTETEDVVPPDGFQWVEMFLVQVVRPDLVPVIDQYP